MSKPKGHGKTASPPEVVNWNPPAKRDLVERALSDGSVTYISVRADLVHDCLSVDRVVDLIRDGTLQAPEPI
jgi:hypothetical protein